MFKLDRVNLGKSIFTVNKIKIKNANKKKTTIFFETRNALWEYFDAIFVSVEKFAVRVTKTVCNFFMSNHEILTVYQMKTIDNV